jgi:hypothetical protein
MMNMKRCLLAAVAATAAVASLPSSVYAEDVQAILMGTDVQPNATGVATYRVHGGRGRGLEVSVSGVDLTDTVWVLVNGDIVAQIAIVGTRGGAGLETARGDDVPDIQPGDVIEIADEDGTVLLSGAF